jgi:hypothetical protein
MKTTREYSSNIISNETQITSTIDVAAVYDIILDETHEYIKKNKASIADIGSVIFRLYDDFTTPTINLPIAKPLNKNFKNIPVRNEKIRIIKNGFGIFYERLQFDISPINSANEKEISNKLELSKNKTNTQSNQIKLTNYKKVENTNIVNVNGNVSKNYDGFGKYFTSEQGIHKLKLYEGDSLIESRFGQSIRFSGWNNGTDDKTRTFSPSIIIRNDENAISKKKDLYSLTEEDVNKDGSIIAMTSNKHQLAFSSEVSTKPDSFMEYPSKLIGDQILLNSGRIIFSAKSGELIFHSKKNYGFISDGGMSIDNKLGIDVSVKDNINIITNDRDIVMYTGNGSIFLGNNELEPMVKGQQLVDLLQELIVAIMSQQYLTPSGPSAMGPENFNDFISISEKLNNILSKQNQTS